MCEPLSMYVERETVYLLSVEPTHYYQHSLVHLQILCSAGCVVPHLLEFVTFYVLMFLYVFTIH